MTHGESYTDAGGVLPSLGTTPLVVYDFSKAPPESGVTRSRDFLRHQGTSAIPLSLIPVGPLFEPQRHPPID
jgi:hypothetical protein